ncbi:hypothetical protein GOODEAATRI_021432 [Goodea atripinnis]|uniref:Uncharacterized protein n=1 Tax=Goodea atripinnis TaxID=208336 RepID=A0ABV0Q019_9TELE
MRCPMILMSCRCLSAAKESIRILYMSSGESLRVQDFVPSVEFSILLSLSSSNVVMTVASDILRCSSSGASPKFYSSSSSWVDVSWKLGMFSKVMWFSFSPFASTDLFLLFSWHVTNVE